MFDDLSKVIFVDSNILNYATFYPGKLLGSTLTVELAVDGSTYTYSKKTLSTKWKLSKENENSLPFSLG